MSNDGGGATTPGKFVLTLEYDCDTFQVEIGGVTMPLSLAQMIVDEAGRLLAEKRRIAAAIQLQQQIQEHARAQAIADSVRGQRH